jgi:hypothetical protein
MLGLEEPCGRFCWHSPGGRSQTGHEEEVLVVQKSLDGLGELFAGQRSFDEIGVRENHFVTWLSLQQGHHRRVEAIGAKVYGD